MRKVIIITLTGMGLILFYNGGFHPATIITGTCCIAGAGIIATSKDK